LAKAQVATNSFWPAVVRCGDASTGVGLIRRKGVLTSHRLELLGTFALCAALLTGCATSSTTSPRIRGPLPTSTIRALPGGTFYMLIGQQSDSENLWLFTNGGTERELTHNPEHYGISNFDASRAGILIANPIGGGVDQLERLVSGGRTAALNTGRGGHAIAGAISPTGTMALLTVPYRGQPWRIGLEETISGPPMWIYSGIRSLSGPSQPSFGPGSRLAIVDPSQGTRPPPKILVHNKASWHQVHTTIANGNFVIMSPNGRQLLITTNNNRSGVLSVQDGTVKWLPKGWFGMVWSPNGARISAAMGSKLGIANAAEPGSVRTMGSFASGFGAAQIVWLLKPASLTKPAGQT